MGDESTSVPLVAAGFCLGSGGKLRVQEAFYSKGRGFLQAAVLLAEDGGDASACNYLLAQGMEVTLKALLVSRNYDHYNQGKLKRLGHDLLGLVEECRREFGLNRLAAPAMRELERLNTYYTLHHLRYASGWDVLGKPQRLAVDRLLRVMCAVCRLAERELERCGVIEENPGISSASLPAPNAG